MTKSLVSGMSMGCGCDRGEKNSLAKAKAMDLTGTHSNMLTYLRDLPRSLKSPEKPELGFQRTIACLCACGREHTMAAALYISGKTLSCGCHKLQRITEVQDAKRKDITGLRFTRLVVLGLAEERTPHGARLWRCVCDCGNEKLATKVALEHKRLQSCGCLAGVHPSRAATQLGNVAMEKTA